MRRIAHSLSSCLHGATSNPATATVAIDAGAHLPPVPVRSPQSLPDSPTRPIDRLRNRFSLRQPPCAQHVGDAVTIRAAEADTVVPDSFNRDLEAWANEVPAEHAERQIAAIRIRAAFHSPALSLRLLNLSSLPDCLDQMSDLRRLHVSGNRLRALPSTWPPALAELDVSSNFLRHLPDSFPASLKTLIASKNHLDALPSLPAQLRNLQLCFNRIREIRSSVLPATLGVLTLSHNQLSRLPEILPARLRRLSVDHNQLRQLPATLPRRLQFINAAHNDLTSLPSGLPPFLDVLNLEENQITQIASSLLALQRRCTVLLDHNPLSPVVIDWISSREPASGDDGVVSARQLVGPAIQFSSAATSTAVRDSTPVAESVAAWYALEGSDDHEAVVHCTRRHDLWSRLYPLTDDAACPGGSGPDVAADDPHRGVENFSRLLTRLQESREFVNCRMRPVLVRRVTSLLDQLSGDSALRATCFAIATEQNATCGDRVALAFDEMEVAALLAGAEGSNANQNELLKLGIGLFKLDVLQKIACETSALLQTEEELEVHLALRSKLGDALGLPTRTTDMLYIASSELDASDFDRALQTVLDAMQDRSGITDFLAAWAPWQRHVQVAYLAEFAPLQAACALRETEIGNCVHELMFSMPENPTREGDCLLQIDALVRERTGLFNTIMMPAIRDKTSELLFSDGALERHPSPVRQNDNRQR